jgi:glycogen operon protein
VLGEFGYRFTGSSDLYELSARKPHASINFVTCHDGFTLRDLTSYNEKHNEANGEENRDGESHNRSWNCGAEGETEDASVLALRKRQQRNLLVTLFLSQGVPMLLAGDELGHTQRGNNNAYCQDNELSWIDWEHVDGELLAFTRRLIRFYREHPVFRRRGWFQGRAVHAEDGQVLHDIAWFTPEGKEMVGEDWSRAAANVLGIFLDGEGIVTPDDRGRRVVDQSFYLMLNAHGGPTRFQLPDVRWGKAWTLALDTARGFVEKEGAPTLDAGEPHELASYSLAVWMR